MKKSCSDIYIVLHGLKALPHTTYQPTHTKPQGAVNKNNDPSKRPMGSEISLGINGKTGL